MQPIGQIALLPGTLKNLFYPPEKGEYQYFKRAESCPFTGGNTIVKAAWAADAAMLSYARYGPQRMSPGDLDDNLRAGGLKLENLIGDWNAPGPKGLFAANDQFAILAFRGTEVDDNIDKFDDIDILLVHEPDYRPAAQDRRPGLLHFSLIEHLFSEPCLVHQGFQRALNQLWSQVHDCVTTYRQGRPNAEICVTGHSLGAALAVLCFSRFNDPKMSLFTFGCPRVGNSIFRERVLENSLGRVHRYVNLNDPVAHVPLQSALYCHAPQDCFRFDDNGSLVPDSGSFKGDAGALQDGVTAFPSDFRNVLDGTDAPPGLVDHSPARYCIRLWNCVPG
jgi:Lipase (class 3)